MYSLLWGCFDYIYDLCASLQSESSHMPKVEMHFLGSLAEWLGYLGQNIILLLGKDLYTVLQVSYFDGIWNAVLIFTS